MDVYNYKEVLFQECLERGIEDQKIDYLSEQYEHYAEKVIPDLKQRNKLSDLRTGYGAACKEAGWYSGFYTAVQIFKEFDLI